MTKTEATRKARRTLASGHYRRSTVEYYAHCPDCREEITAHVKAFDSAITIEMELRAVLVDHFLSDDCDQKWA